MGICNRAEDVFYQFLSVKRQYSYPLIMHVLVPPLSMKVRLVLVLQEHLSPAYPVLMNTSITKAFVMPL